MGTPEQLSREDVLRYRLKAQQLDRPAEECAVTDAAIFDLGVQYSGGESASWSLVNRGVPIAHPAELNASAEIALLWTLRGAPHFYRRSDLANVRIATSPFSEADAGKRMFDANKPLMAAGISATEAISAVSVEMRRRTAEPISKGDLSGQLAKIMPEPYLRWCRPCQATHLYEMPFRLAALYGGLELEPGTSPPVIRRITNWRTTTIGPADDPLAAPDQLQPIRAYLRLFGPATPKQVAAYLDAPVAEVKARWPDDAVDVLVESSPASALASTVPQLVSRDETTHDVRLIHGFDLFLQGRDRSVLVPDTARHKQLWPVLGRPGAILRGPDVVGVWRPKASGKKLTLRLDYWSRPSKALSSGVEEQATRLAAHRGLSLNGLVEE